MLAGPIRGIASLRQDALKPEALGSLQQLEAVIEGEGSSRGTHDQDGTGSVSHDFLGNAAKQCSGHAGATVAGYDDEIGGPFIPSPF
jgi:hypothetical protein